MNKVLQFRDKIKKAAPPNMKYVLVVVDADGDDGFIEHSPELDGYQVLGVLEWGKTLKLKETEI